MASPRNLGFSIHGCRERCPDGIYRGFVCCAQAGHDGPHAVTSGSTEPPYYVIVHEWVTPVSGGTSYEDWAGMRGSDKESKDG